jgi:hypothetical protein
MHGGTKVWLIGRTMVAAMLLGALVRPATAVPNTALVLTSNGANGDPFSSAYFDFAVTPPGTQKMTRAIRPPGSDVRTSQSPSPSARQSGIPTGQRYRTRIRSCPIAWRSASSRSRNQSRTASRPEAVR